LKQKKQNVLTYISKQSKFTAGDQEYTKFEKAILPFVNHVVNNKEDKKIIVGAYLEGNAHSRFAEALYFKKLEK
jgi:hypothetical protein